MTATDLQKEVQWFLLDIPFVDILDLRWFFNQNDKNVIFKIGL